MMPVTSSDLLDEREARLPKWAQELIVGLRCDVRDANRTARRAAQGTREGAVVFVDYYRDEIAVGVAKRNERVLFSVNGTDDRWSSFQVSLDREGVLEVMGGSKLMVVPQATNVVQILAEGR